MIDIYTHTSNLFILETHYRFFPSCTYTEFHVTLVLEVSSYGLTESSRTLDQWVPVLVLLNFYPETCLRPTNMVVSVVKKQGF